MRSRWWFGLAAVVMVLAACGGSSSSASEESFCGRLSELVSADGLELEDPEQAAQAVEIVRGLRDAAPSEIRDDVGVLADFVETFAEIDPDDEEAAFEALGEFLVQGDQLEAAGERVERYASEECGVALDDIDADADADAGADDDADTASEEDADGDLGLGDTDLFDGDGPDTYGDDPSLDALWDDCAGGDLAACDTLYLTTPIGSDYEDFGSTCGRTTAATFGQCSDEPVGGTDIVDGYGDDPVLDALWDACDAGSFSDCDALYYQSPFDSSYEAFGASCGGRSDGGNGFCAAGDTTASPTYGEDPALDVLWDACALGDPEACNDLYWDSPIGSGYEAFGSTCGETQVETRGGCGTVLDTGDIFTYGDDAALDLLWDECAAGLSDSCDELYFVSPIGSEYEDFGSTCGQTRTATLGGCSLIDEGAAFGYGDDPVLDALWDDCANGDGAACDDLYFDSPLGSAYETFGETCGDRVEAAAELCADQIGAG
ncbi:MAG: hypothetical protein AAFZ07_12525 [Actinomycetota bacterium]